MNQKAMCPSHIATVAVMSNYKAVVILMSLTTRLLPLKTYHEIRACNDC